MNIVVMPHEICGKRVRLLLLSEFGRNRLKLFDERVFDAIAIQSDCSGVMKGNFLASSMIKCPGGDRDRLVGGGVIEAYF